MATMALAAGVPPVGIQGTVLGNLQGSEAWYVNHRLAVYLFFSLFATTLNHGVRTLVPYFRKNYPLRMAYNAMDIAKLVAICVVSYLVYAACMGGAVEPRYKDDFLTAHRISANLCLHALYTAVYYISMKVMEGRLPAAQIPAQAANVVRIGLKTSVFVWWCCSGKFLDLMATHPLDLTQELFWQGNAVAFLINTLYTWELLFRDLRPVNVIHHAIACMGACSFMEWANLLEPARVVTALPVIGSLIETFVCMGSVAYRFMPKGKALSRLLLAVTIFVIVAYNLLLAGFLSVYISYFQHFSWGYGRIGMPCLVMFTYPAQMNMAKVFWSLYKKSLREAKTIKVVETVKNTSFTVTAARRQP